jgi:hypothetical protein
VIFFSNFFIQSADDSLFKIAQNSMGETLRKGYNRHNQSTLIEYAELNSSFCGYASKYYRTLNNQEK